MPWVAPCRSTRFCIFLSIPLFSSCQTIFPFEFMLEEFSVSVHVGTLSNFSSCWNVSNSDELLGVKHRVASSFSVMAEIAVASALTRLATIG